MITAVIGLGANLDDPAQQIKDALSELDQLPNSQLVKQSSLYRSKPVGPQDQPDFVNAVAMLATELEPIALLDALQDLEQKHGRIRKRHWGERTLDLDIILYGDQTLSTERLTVPHAFAQERSFVMFPLLEIAPRLQFPDGETVSKISQSLENDVIPLR